MASLSICPVTGCLLNFDNRLRLSWNVGDASDAPPPGRLVSRGLQTAWALRNVRGQLVLDVEDEYRSAVLEGAEPSLAEPNSRPWGWLSPDRLTIAVCRTSDSREGAHRPVGQIFVWDTRTGRRLFVVPEGQGGIEFDPTGRWMATTDLKSREVWVWDVRAAQVAHRTQLPALPSFDLPGVKPHGLRVHPQGDRLLFEAQGVLRLWDVTASREVARVEKPGHFTPVDHVAVSEATGLVASGSGEGIVFLWNRQTGELVRFLVGPDAPLESITFSPDGRNLATASTHGTITLWDTSSGRPRWTYQDPHLGTTFVRLMYHPEKSILFAGSRDGRILVFNAESGDRQHIYELAKAPVRALALSPKGDQVAIVSGEGRVQLRDIGGSDARRSWDVGATVDDVTFLGRGGILVTGGRDVRFFEAGSGALFWSSASTLRL